MAQWGVAQADQALQQIGQYGRQLSLRHQQQEMDFRRVIERHQHAQSQASERSRLERHRNDLLAKRRLRDELQKQLEALEQARQQLTQRLSQLYNQQFAVREAVAQRISNSLSPAVRVGIVQYGNVELYRRTLERSLRGARVKQSLVAAKLVKAFWPRELSKVIGHKNTGKLVDRAELSSEQAEKVVAALHKSERLFELEMVELPDLPRIELQDGGTYKNCSTLSTGQKCTAILPILLLDSDNPLLVDQPEDNLDNRFIFETVVGSIRKIKARRQLIFATHNPNIPVLGDAERVFVLDSDGAAGRKANEGTVEHCEPQIVTLLEGGVEAFKLRRKKYVSCN